MKFQDLVIPGEEGQCGSASYPEWRMRQADPSWMYEALRPLYGAGIYPYSSLFGMYAEPQRFYHTADHVAQTFEAAALMTKQYRVSSDVIYLALAFHDAVYVPGGKHNEELSALYAVKMLNRVKEETLNAIVAAIQATKIHALPDTLEEAIVMDADLWCLGSEAAEFDLNGENIIKEYLTVYSLDDVKAGRVQWIEEFVKRDRIFHTALGAEREQVARDNLERERQALRV